MSATLAHTTYHPSPCFWQGSHVLTYLRQAIGPVWTVKDPAYSMKSFAFVARWHPGSSVLRTSQLSITGDWMPFSGSLPDSAIVSDMAIYEHPTWAHRTAESDGSRSPGRYPLWPTLLAGDSRCAAPNQNSRTLGRRVRNMDGNSRLNPEWAEAFMGFPAGWTLPGTNGPRDQVNHANGSQSRARERDKSTTGNE